MTDAPISIMQARCDRDRSVMRDCSLFRAKQLRELGVESKGKVTVGGDGDDLFETQPEA